jgi:hypothetical protein
MALEGLAISLSNPVPVSMRKKEGGISAAFDFKT